MPFLKFSRDKRGYEHFYLVEPGTRNKGRTELLYWFRTPPNIKVGRGPFDPDVRRELEAQHPEVAFDWAAIVRTPIPPPVEPERWRERRRVERAMRAAGDEGPDEDVPPDSPPAVLPPVAAAAAVEAGATAASVIEQAETVADEPRIPDASAPDAAREPSSASNVATPGPHDSAPGRRHRRRRRGPRPQPQGEV